ncbi:MAG: tripartite tricarboxylate transporter permease [Dehalobacterium sp.]
MLLENLLMGFACVFQVQSLIGLMIGTVMGYFVGSMPGLTPSIGIALIVPFTFGMDPVVAMVMLVSLYIAAEYGGGITAILINCPGTPAAAATAWDGYPMAQRGEAGKALAISVVSSFTGSVISSILLILTAIPMARFALSFGPLEYFALAVFGLSLVSSLSSGSLLKGFLGMFFGLLIATIGLDPVNGVPRFALTPALFEGIPFLPALIGLFAMSEVFFMLENADENPVNIQNIKGIGIPFSLYRKLGFVLARSSLLGYIIGVIPGAGATIASLISYNETRRVAKDKSTFGKGNPAGISASEAANNSAVAGAMAPLLALGVPGSASAAIMIGALTIQGLQPGPLLFTNNPEIPYSIFIALLTAAPIMLCLGLAGVRLWAKVTLIPKGILAVVVSGISILGAYSFSNSMHTVWVTLCFGLIGYMMRKVEIPTAPVVLALVLGFMAEVNFRRAIVVSHGDFSFIFDKPIAIVLLIVSLLTLIIPLVQQLKSKPKVKCSENI